MNVGVIEFNDIMGWDSSNKIGFGASYMPKGRGIIPAKSIYDYNSFNYMRARNEIVIKARSFAYKIKGKPVGIPENDNRIFSTIV